MSLRDKVEGNELDLSLNVLTEIPVNELAAAPKATHLDISCNQIRSIPNDFATLTHLVKIDLSKNKLSELPANFGNLVNLQHLDLYGNQITTLPVSFYKLKNLRWLDLKNNPLEPKLKNVAGDCLNEKECKECAKKVVAYMQTIESELEREREKKLKIAREKEAIERAKIERELEEQRRLKKLEKERRKAEIRAKREAQELQHNAAGSHHQRSSDPQDNKETGSQQFQAHETNGINCTKVFTYSFFVVCLIFLGCFIWAIHTEYISVDDLKSVRNQVVMKIQRYISEMVNLMLFYWPKMKENFLKIVHRYMTDVTYYASQIEQILALYF
ncbi:leucine-rich repeat-containing protein 59 [Nephila pilipes]|uniref:Leucine-rich repeat-containing protein 59 n=1 Tax=Nephila pilipes TaxID=299642 RepID=A0A8X6PGS4_NEPPI|nr:leucine-rich repeat-containing protein 59 [Nephila pilipes]